MRISAAGSGTAPSGFWVQVWAGFLVFSAACATTAPGSEEAQNQAKQEYEESRKVGYLGMRDQQVVHLQEAIRLSPENLNYRLALGLLYSIMGTEAKAEQEFLQILTIDSGNKSALRELGRIYLRKGEWARAAKNFEEVLQGPGPTAEPHQVYNWLALSYYNQQKLEQAEQAWLQAIRISENAGVRYNLALAYKEQERFDLAQESLEKAVAMKPDFTQALFELAQLELKNKHIDQAITYFEKVVRLDPGGRWGRSSQEYLKLVRPVKSP